MSYTPQESKEFERLVAQQGARIAFYLESAKGYPFENFQEFFEKRLANPIEQCYFINKFAEKNPKVINPITWEEVQRK